MSHSQVLDSHLPGKHSASEDRQQPDQDQIGDQYGHRSIAHECNERENDHPDDGYERQAEPHERAVSDDRGSGGLGGHQPIMTDAMTAPLILCELFMNGIAHQVEGLGQRVWCHHQ